MYLSLFVGFLCLVFFFNALLSAISSLAIIFTRKRGLVALFLLFSWCIVIVSVLWLFLMVPRVGLQCAIMVFSE